MKYMIVTAGLLFAASTVQAQTLCEKSREEVKQDVMEQAYEDHYPDIATIEMLVADALSSYDKLCGDDKN